MGRGRHGDHCSKARQTLTPAENSRALRGQSGAVQMPALIEFVDALPRNATGKIHKPTLRKQFNALKATDKIGS